MAGYARKKDGPPARVTFTLKMHEVVANLMCKLVEAGPFSNVRRQMDEVKSSDATGGWKVGEKATDKLVEWCQGQWRRKAPDLPLVPNFGNGVSTSVPLFAKPMPVCHSCRVPCPDCREELGQDVPPEMMTMAAFINYEEIHRNDENSQPSEPECGESTPWDSRRLRKRLRKEQ